MPGQWPDSKVRSAGRIPTVEPPRSCSLSLSTWSLRVKLFTTWRPGNANMISPTKPACPRTFATTSSTSSVWMNPVRSLSSGNWPAQQATTNSRPSHWECQDFCVWGGYSRGSPTRLPFVFEMQYARPDAIAGAKVEGPARSAGGSSLAPAIARREAAGALAREV